MTLEAPAVPGRSAGGATSAAGGSRLSRRRRPLVVDLVLITLAVVVLFWRPLTGQSVFLGADVLGRYAPWHDAPEAGVSLRNLFVGDTLDAEYPALEDESAGWRHGRLPTWLDEIQAGVPTATAPSWFPLNAIYALVPLGYGLGLHAALRVWLGAVGMYLLLRRHGASRLARLLAAAAFALSGFNAEWLSWPQSNASLLIPWLFLAAEVALTSRRLAAAAGVAVAAAAIVYAPFPALAVSTFLALTAYVAVRAIALRREGGRILGGVGLVAVGGMVGVGLALPYLLPLAQELARINVGYRQAYSTVGVPIQTFVSWIAPNALGTAGTAHRYVGWASPVEAIQFAGVLALPLALAAFWRRRQRSVVVAYGLIAVVLILTIYGPLVAVAAHVPLIKQNPVWRMNAITGFAVAALAGLGLDEVVGRIRSRRRLATIVLAWGLLALAVSRISLRAMLIGLRTPALRSGHFVSQQWGWVAVVVAVFLVTVTLARIGRVPARSVAVVAVTLTVADMLLFWVPLQPVAAKADLFPSTPGIRVLQRGIGDGRLLPLQAFPGDTPSVYGISSVRSHAFHVPHWNDVIQLIDPKPFQSPTYDGFSAERTRFGAPVLDLLRVRYVADWGAGAPLGQRVVAGGGAAPKVVTLTAGAPAVSAAVPIPGGASRFTGVGLEPIHGDQHAVLRIDVRTGDRAFSRTLSAGDARRGVLAALEGERRAGPEVVVTVRMLRGGPVQLRSFDGRRPAVLVYEGDPATPTHLRLVYGGEMTVYERPSASFPRAFLAGEVAAGQSPAVVLKALADGGTDLRRVAMLEGPAPAGVAATPAGAGGSPGDVAVTGGADGGLRLRATAARAAMLVVTDAYHPGWSATVDGRPAPVVEVDHVFRGVPVGPGTHEVVLRYRPPGMGVALVGAAVALVMLLALMAGAVVQRRRR